MYEFATNTYCIMRKGAMRDDIIYNFSSNNFAISSIHGSDC